MNLKKLVRSVKNYIKMASKGEAFVELFDVEDNSVVFEAPTVDDIQVGTPATPDGEFLFTDGSKIIIEGGVVTAIEKPATVEEEVKVEEKPVNEVKVEEKPAAEEVKVEESKKDAKIAELEAQVAKLMEEIESLKGDIAEKDGTIKEAEKELGEIQNFYVALNKSQLGLRSSEVKPEEGMSFSFKKK